MRSTRVRILMDELRFLQHTHTTRMDRTERLTERQREVLQLLAEGKLMKEVARALQVSMSTVAFHKYRIMKAVGVSTNADLIRYAVRNNIIAS